MSNSSVGALHEREAVAKYQSEGWQVFRPQKTSMYGSQDIFNMWDLVAIKETRLHFVQVKTKDTDGFLKKLQKWRNMHPVPGVEWHLWVRLDARKSGGEKWKKY